MTQCDSAQKIVDNSEAQIGSSNNSERATVDMTNAHDLKAVFGTNRDLDQSVVSDSGHLIFNNPYQSKGAGDAGSNLAKFDQQLLRDLQTLEKDLTTLDGELAQLISGTEGAGGNGAPVTGSDSGSGTAVGTTTGSDSGSGSATTTGSDSGSGGATTTGSDSGSGGATTTGSDAGSGGATTTGSDSGSGGATTTGSDSGSGGATTTGSNSSGGIDVPGVTSANNATLAADNASLVDGQGTGPDALHLASSNSGLASVNPDGQGFAQRYGYFEATAKIESGGSGWPGTWLESLYHAENPNASPSAEIDFMEAQTGNSNGQGDNAYYATLHSSSTVDGTTPGTTDQTNSNSLISGLPNLSAGYHTFGINDQPNDPDIEFYLDGKDVANVPKYSDTDGSPMLLNLDNITGGWNNAPADTATGPLDVQSVRVFQDANLINASNDPGGTIGTDLTNLSASQAPPDIPGVSWVNTFNSDFSNGGISASADGHADNTLWTAATPEYPYEPWNLNGVSSGPA